MRPVLSTVGCCLAPTDANHSTMAVRVAAHFQGQSSRPVHHGEGLKSATAHIGVQSPVVVNLQTAIMPGKRWEHTQCTSRAKVGAGLVIGAHAHQRLVVTAVTWGPVVISAAPEDSRVLGGPESTPDWHRMERACAGSGLRATP